MKREELPER